MPALRPHALIGAIQYYDGQLDDARHTLFVARTAVQYGAVAATSVRAVGLSSSHGAVVGATVRDLESGQEFTVRARHVINATGVFIDQVQGLAPGTSGLRVTASKGVHLVVPHDCIDSTTGLITRAGGSVLFVIPWQGSHWLIGTTDTPWDLDLSHPAASRRDINYLLEQVNRILVRPLTTEDIVGVYAGLRPLLAGESDATSKLSREHAVVTPVPGMTLVAGGKYTTYRVMARDAVDAAGPCRSRAPARKTFRCSGRTVTPPRGTAEQPSLRSTTSISFASNGCSGATGRCSPRSWHRPMTGRTSCGHWAALPATCVPRRSTRSAPKAPCTSMTSSPGVPASRSRHRTADWRWPRRSRN